MSREDVKKLLCDLHDEIQKMQPVSKNSKSRLEELIHDLEKQLKTTEDEFRTENILENLSKLIEEFEVQHPGITNLLSKLSMSLSNMGI